MKPLLGVGLVFSDDWKYSRQRFEELCIDFRNEQFLIFRELRGGRERS